MRALLLLPVLAGVAAPVQAQIAGQRDYGPAPTASPFLPDSSLAGPDLGRQLAQQRGRIREARESGLISRREARALNREARLIAGIARRYARDGLTAPERREVETRSCVLDGAIGAAQVRR